MTTRARKVVVMKDGPYEVQVPVPLSHQTIVTNGKGESLDWKEGAHLPAPEGAHLCRCGQSGNRAFCDGSHASIKFRDDR